MHIEGEGLFVAGNGTWATGRTQAVGIGWQKRHKTELAEILLEYCSNN